VPADLRARADTVPDVAALAGQARRRFVDGAWIRSGELARARFRVRARERLVDRLRYGLAFALTPDVEDFNAVSLPDRLFGLYRLVRPPRLAAVIASAALRRPAPAPYVPSPMALVEAILEMATVGPEDVVKDLGCGDGRIMIVAAQRYGARGVGIDLDPERVAESRANAEAARVGGRVEMVQGNALAMDLSAATVVTLWTAPILNLQLRPRLLAQLKPGARVVGHGCDMGGWVPDETRLVMYGDGEVAVAYLWRIVDGAAGR